MAKTLVYQLYPLSWSGIREMTAFLPRIRALGATHVWLSPIYPSPRCDHGYDVADYYGIDYRIGSMAEFDGFVRTAHALGLKVIMDLILNHTSIDHPWFKSRPDFYVRSKHDKPGWVNLFDGGSAWQYDEARGDYYCHLFHKGQADLNWFPSGVPNKNILEEFKLIIEYWMYVHGVDGFRLDAIQALNKKISRETLGFDDLLIGERATLIVNMLSHTKGKKTPFLIAEVFDPQFGRVVDYYSEKTNTEYITNAMLKSSAVQGDLKSFRAHFANHVRNPRFILELESHDAPRFTSRSGLSGYQILSSMFDPDGSAQAICLYQGQELGLPNPTATELPLSEMVKLDVLSSMQLDQGASIESLRANSRANARTPIPMDVYAKQEQDKGSILSKTKDLIHLWQNSY